MKSSSSLITGLQAFQRAKQSVTNLASDIHSTKVTTKGNAHIGNDVSVNGNSMRKVPELNPSLVNLRVAEHHAKASSEIIKNAIQALGTLLDIRA
jgi:hypothetical protein